MNTTRVPRAVGLNQPYFRNSFVAKLVRNEIGPAELIQVLLYLTVAARIAFGVDKTHGEPLRAGVIVLIAAVHVYSGWRVWFDGLEGFDLRRRRHLAAFLVWLASTVGLFAIALTFVESADVTTFAMSARDTLLVAVMVHGVGPFGTIVKSKFMPLVPLGIVGLLALLHVLADQPVPTTLLVVGLVAGVTYGFVMRFNAWRTQVWDLWEQSQERVAHAAVTEERLRVSRDIHDVVGRALSAIAVKSELATELARRGHDDAITEMRAVRELAQESMAEARRLAAGYRSADIVTELAGGRSLLNSIGVTTRLVGSAEDLPPHAQDVLGWVVRESTTNIVRHSTATYSVLDIALTADEAVLTITNDGVPPREDGPRDLGSGLSGLRERVISYGGSMTARQEGPRFILQARVPRTATSLVEEARTVNIRSLVKD